MRLSQRSDRCKAYVCKPDRIQINDYANTKAKTVKWGFSLNGTVSAWAFQIHEIHSMKVFFDQTNRFDWFHQAPENLGRDHNDGLHKSYKSAIKRFVIKIYKILESV